MPIRSFSIDYAHMDQPLQGADIKNATSKFLGPAETVTKYDLRSVCVPENQCEDETEKVLDDVKSLHFPCTSMAKQAEDVSNKESEYPQPSATKE